MEFVWNADCGNKVGGYVDIYLSKAINFHIFAYIFQL